MAARAARWLGRRAVLDVGRGVGATVLVAGSARSGTTWFAGCLARALKARSLFEPFIVDDRGQLFCLRPRPWEDSATRRSVSRYLPEASSGDPWEAGVARVLAGAVSLRWEDHDPPGLYRRRVVKAVRANLLLGHVIARWPRMPVVWLVRDPLEVVASQLEMRGRGWDFDWQPECVLSQPALMRDWLAPFEDVVRGAEALLDRLTVRWCVENLVPWRQATVGQGALRIWHRDLYAGTEPWAAVSRLLVQRGFARSRRLDAQGVLRGLRVGNGVGVRSGAEGLRASERDRVLRLVERFGLLDLARSGAAPQ